MVSKVNRAKSPLFFPLESLETRLDKFSNGLDKFSNGFEHLETRLEPRSSDFGAGDLLESEVATPATKINGIKFQTEKGAVSVMNSHFTHEI